MKKNEPEKNKMGKQEHPRGKQELPREELKNLHGGKGKKGHLTGKEGGGEIETQPWEEENPHTMGKKPHG